MLSGDRVNYHTRVAKKKGQVKGQVQGHLKTTKRR